MNFRIQREQEKLNAQTWAKSKAGQAWGARNYSPRYLWPFYGVFVEDKKVVYSPYIALCGAANGPRKRFDARKVSA